MPRVLVADDSDALRLLVRITVESQGWSVLEAGTGHDALRQVADARPDLILLDLDLGDPTLDGVAVCERIRADPAIAEIPIIVLTGSDRVEDRERASRAGADHFMTKPFGPLDLLDAMRRVLRQYLSGAGLGLYLVDAGVLTPEDLQRAVDQQRHLALDGQRVQIGALLIDMGAISDGDLVAALGRQRRELGSQFSGEERGTPPRRP